MALTRVEGVRVPRCCGLGRDGLDEPGAGSRSGLGRGGGGDKPTLSVIPALLWFGFVLFLCLLLPLELSRADGAW